MDFLPATPAEVAARGWDAVDVVFVTGDAYVDHPSFAMALLGRVLEAEGYRVAILSQPDWHSCDAWRSFGRPRLCFAISAGNMDSMLNHYTATRKVPQRRRLQSRRADRPAARSSHLGLLSAGPRGLSGRAGNRRRRGGQPAPPGPLRFLERQGPPLHPAGLQGRPRGLRHGRAAARRYRRIASMRATASANSATCGAWPIAWGPAKACRRGTQRSPSPSGRGQG